MTVITSVIAVNYNYLTQKHTDPEMRGYFKKNVEQFVINLITNACNTIKIHIDDIALFLLDITLYRIKK